MKLMQWEQTKPYGVSPKEVLEHKNGTLLYREGFKIKFSCPFDFGSFPFDSQTCCLDYQVVEKNMDTNMATVIYDNDTTVDDSPIEIKNLPLPFEITISSIHTNEQYDNYKKEMYNHTGMRLRMKRKYPLLLFCSFYYPTAAFALLSIISFLIKPDMVSTYAGKKALE